MERALQVLVCLIGLVEKGTCLSHCCFLFEAFFFFFLTTSASHPTQNLVPEVAS